MTLTYDPTVVGYAYLISQGDLHKIGHSANPHRRLGEVANPAIARVVHMIPSTNPETIERALHRRFAGVRVQGEWFRLTEDDVASICTLARVDAVDDLPEDLRRDLRRPLISDGVQINFRATNELFTRLKSAADTLGLDVSNLVRMILIKGVSAYEREAAAVIAEREANKS